MASETPTRTGTVAATALSSGTSRASSGPFVRMEKGVPESARAVMMPGMSWYRPSAR